MKNSILILIGLVSTSIIVFGFVSNQSTTEELLIGTWIEEGSTIDYKWVIDTGQAEVYVEGKVSKTYSWSIESGQTPSGLTYEYLIMENLEDQDRILTYNIDHIDNEILTLTPFIEKVTSGKAFTLVRQ